MAGGDKDAANADTLASVERDPAVSATASASIGSRPTEREAAAVRASVGRYQLVEQLGAGGMGQVYRARDPDLNRDVAIKLLHPTAADSRGAAELQRRMLREAQAMAKVRHVNLAVVHDVGTESGDVFIAMELIEGPTLKQWLRAERPWRERLAAVVAAGHGLAAAHAADVVHRDFKPDNVLLDADGVAKVVDFGLARGVGEHEPHRSRPPLDAADALATPLTMTGALMGTPAYMAPEQHAGARAGAAADQFSLAVTVYEALYGRRPFDGKVISEIAKQAAAGEIAEPGRTDVPAELFAVLQRALAPSPDDRYASVADFLAALEHAARPISHRRSIGLVAAVVVAAAIVVAVVATRGGDTPAPAAPVAGASDEPRGRLSKEAITGVVRANSAPIGACYDQARTASPDIGEGVITVRFHIAASGRVQRTEIEKREGLDDDLAACVGSETMRWKFPPPEGGGQVEVIYPFHFKEETVGP